VLSVFEVFQVYMLAKAAFAAVNLASGHASVSTEDHTLLISSIPSRHLKLISVKHKLPFQRSYQILAEKIVPPVKITQM
jgi:hypothetical protein